MSQPSDNPVSLDDVIKEALEKSLQEKEQETSYLPMYLLIFNLILLFLGFCWYFMQSSAVCMIDSLWPLILKSCGVALLIYQMPLFFACRTAYQIKTRRSFSTFITFNSMALCGFLLFLHPLLHTYNAFGRQSNTIRVNAEVVRAEYQTGSSRSTGRFIADIIAPPHFSDEVRVTGITREHYLQMQQSKTTAITIHSGALGFRWLKIEE